MPTDDTPTPDPLYLALRSARGKRTLRSVAADVGIDFTYLSKIEHGHDRPSRDLVARLDDTYGAGGSLVGAFDDLPCPRCGCLAARPSPDTGLREALTDDEWADVVDVYGSFGSRLVANRLEAALADRETNHAD